MRPGWGAGTRDSIQIPFIELHTALAEELDVFLPEGARAVVLLLPFDVMPHILAHGCADGERAVALLPRKRAVADGLMHPLGRGALEVAHHIREAMRRFQPGKDMDVVGDTAHALRNGVHLAEDAAEIGVESFPPFRGDERAAFLRGKDDVVMQAEMSRRHGGIFPRPIRGARLFSWRFRWGRFARHRLISINASGGDSVAILLPRPILPSSARRVHSNC